MAVYFLTFFCHRLFEALFVKKTQERKHPLFKYSHLSHKANFFKLAETEGNKTAKGTAKQKRTKPGVHSSWPPLNSVSEVSCFPWDHWAAWEPSTCFTGPKFKLSPWHGLWTEQWRTALKLSECSPLLRFQFFPLCVSNTSCSFGSKLKLHWL